MEMTENTIKKFPFPSYNTPPNFFTPEIYSTTTFPLDGATYRWRMKLWDQTDTAGEWSAATSTFAMGYPLAHDLLQELSYVYDAAGNITRIEDMSSTTARMTVEYSYDDLNRLITASTTMASSTPYAHTYEYSSIGNISSSTPAGAYTYAGTNYANPHAATQIGLSSQTYDNNGNLTSDGTFTYAWDYRNRLTLSGNGTASSTYLYDHEGNRVKLTEGGTTTYYPNRYFSRIGTTGTTTKYIFAGDTLVATIDQLGTSTPVVQYVHTDHLGSTNVTTNSSGGISLVKDYMPFGSTRIEDGNTSMKRGYIGQFEDENLIYLNARYQNPAQERFISQDPVFWEVGITNDGRSVLTNPQAQNSYSYANNNPITNKDPDGRIIPAAAIPYILFGIGAFLDSAVTYYSDVRQNQVSGNPNPYTTNLSPAAEYGVGAVGGGASMTFLGGAGRVVSGLGAGTISLGQDLVAGRSPDYGKAGIMTGGTMITGSLFKGLAGVSPLEKAAQRGVTNLTQNTIKQGLRYETVQGTFQSSLNTVAQTNYQTRASTPQVNTSSGGGLSGLLNSLSRALSSFSSLLKK